MKKNKKDSATIGLQYQQEITKGKFLSWIRFWEATNQKKSN